MTLRDIVVRRDRRTVLDIPSLDIERGRTLAVIGPNGAGKTTLVMQLALLERPDEGQVIFEGAPVWRGGMLGGRELELRRRMAVVFQEPLLLDRSVISNVEAGLRLRGVARGERRERAERWLARFGVVALARANARSLSGGESQRVSLARAFALEPEVLLLDEPFSALDQPTRQALIDDLAAVLAETHLTTVLVTHDHDEAARLGDQVAVLMHGRIVQRGVPSEVFGAPANEVVAAFVGVETILEGTVIGRDEGLVLLAVGPHVVEAIDARSFDAALLCLRPEDISIARAGERVPGSARNQLPGRVRRVVAAGADARVEVDCGVPLTARITRRSVEDLNLDVGTEVIASFKATAVHLIPK